MRILILGGAGMVGQKVANYLVENGLNNEKISELILYDVVDAKIPKADFPITVLSGNIADPAQSKILAEIGANVIFHLAAIVSGEAEKNFDKGWDINSKGGWNLLEALREKNEASGGAYVPRLIFASSIAVFGGPFPDKINDDFLCAPQTSYGAQKAMVELLVSDYSRKGFIDGFSVRLPTICVRPGKPNLAASSFFSGIIREPLNGVEAILPVADDVRHWHASPRSAAKFFAHAATLDTSLLEGRRSLNLPGVSCTVAEQIEALGNIAGGDAVKLINRQPDEQIISIVDNWPKNFDPVRALKLGFTAEKSFEEIIKVYLDDDFNG